MTGDRMTDDRLKAAVEKRMSLAKRLSENAMEQWSYRETDSGPAVAQWWRECSYEMLHCDDPEDGCMDIAARWQSEGRFIAANSPAFVIRQCERDLKVLERHAPSSAERFDPDDPVRCSGCTHQPAAQPQPCWNDWPCDEVRDLADAYQIDLDMSGGADRIHRPPEDDNA